MLLFVGSLLFLGEWLFGSMGWGLLHGSLLTLALMTGIGLNLGGAWMGAYARGLLWGVVATVVLSLLFASDLLRDAAVGAARDLEGAVALHPDLLPTLVGLAAGAVVFGVVGAAVGWGMDAPSRGPLVLSAVVLGAVMGAILGSVDFDPRGAVAVSLALGLLTWMAASAGLAARRGLDVEGRYAALVPRQSLAALEETREFLLQQWERQKRRIMGR